MDNEERIYDRDPGLRGEHERHRQENRETRNTGNGLDVDPLLPIDPISLVDKPVPPREWLVAEWIPLHRVTAIYGAGGEGKTLLGQMLATTCAIGKPWFGLPTLCCKSLLFYAEDDLAEMHRRQDDINRNFGCGFGDLTRMRWLPWLGYDNALARFESGRALHTPLFEQLRATAKEQESRLIITDTLADVFSGNENDRAQARAFAQGTLGLLAREIQGAVITLAHPSRSGMNSGSGESGSTAWIGTFRSQLYLSTPETDDAEPLDPNLRILTRKKSNAARRAETIELRWKDGVFIPDTPTGILGTIERNSCERVFLALLEKMTIEGQHLSHNMRAGNYAPRVFVTRPERERFKIADFERAMQRLLADKRIAVGKYRDPYRRGIDCLVISTDGT